MELGVSEDMLSRMFDGMGAPLTAVPTSCLRNVWISTASYEPGSQKLS